MITVTKVIAECVSSQKLEVVIPNSLTKKEINKLLVLIKINKGKVIKVKIFYFMR